MGATSVEGEFPVATDTHSLARSLARRTIAVAYGHRRTSPHTHALSPALVSFLPAGRDDQRGDGETSSSSWMR